MSVARIGDGTPGDQPGGGGSSPTATLQGDLFGYTPRERLTVEDTQSVEDAGKCWQRLIREQQARTPEAQAPLPASALATAWVRPINRRQAQRVITDCEWLGNMPAVAVLFYGMYFGERCGGVVVYGPEYAENLGVWDPYGFTGKLLVVSRGACAHWTPTGTASRLIRRSMRLLPVRYEIVTATVDAQAGEIGTIYQACGFHYVGVMGHTRAWWRIDGKVWSSRAIRGALGTQDPDVVRSRFPGAERIMPQAKGRYFAFRANHAEHERAIRHLIQPYPKRRAHPMDSP